MRITVDPLGTEGLVNGMPLEPSKTLASSAAPPRAIIRTTTVESPVPLVSSKPTKLSQGTKRPPMWVFAATGFLLLAAFWPTFDWMIGKWWSDSSYSHGFLVPLVAAYMIYSKRETIGRWFGPPRWWIAAGLLVAAFAMRLVAGGLLFHQLDAVALLVTVVAALLAFGGFPLLKNCWQGLAFLPFMIPLPYEIEQNVGGPLKVCATAGSTFLLQTLGFPAIAEGKTIHIDDIPLEIVDACSGLKMLLGFVAIGAAAVLMLKRTWFEKMLIVLGILPIALATNIFRVTATGVAYTMIVDGGARKALHDGLGYGMLIVGMALLAAELWILNRLVVRPTTDGRTE